MRHYTLTLASALLLSRSAQAWAVPAAIATIHPCVSNCFAMVATQDKCNDMPCHCKHQPQVIQWVGQCTGATAGCPADALPRFSNAFQSVCSGTPGSNGPAGPNSGSSPSTITVVPLPQTTAPPPFSLKSVEGAPLSFAWQHTAYHPITKDGNIIYEYDGGRKGLNFGKNSDAHPTRTEIAQATGDPLPQQNAVKPPSKHAKRAMAASAAPAKPTTTPMDCPADYTPKTTTTAAHAAVTAASSKVAAPQQVNAQAVSSSSTIVAPTTSSNVPPPLTTAATAKTKPQNVTLVKVYERHNSTIVKTVTHVLKSTSKQSYSPALNTSIAQAMAAVPANATTPCSTTLQPVMTLSTLVAAVATSTVLSSQVLPVTTLSVASVQVTAAGVSAAMVPQVTPVSIDTPMSSAAPDASDASTSQTPASDAATTVLTTVVTPIATTTVQSMQVVLWTASSGTGASVGTGATMGTGVPSASWKYVQWVNAASSAMPKPTPTPSKVATGGAASSAAMGWVSLAALVVACLML